MTKLRSAEVLRLLLSEDEILSVPAWREFFGIVCPILLEALFPTGGKCLLEDWEPLVNSLHIASMRFADIENNARFQRRVPAFARRFRLSWTRARSHVEQSIKLVQKAQKGIPSDCLSEVRPGALRFREAIAALGKLNSDLEDLEILDSAIIHPTMRKSRERAFLQRDVLMARRARKFLKHTNYPINRPAAAANQSMFVESVEASIRKFEKKSRIGQMPLTRMDELICRIFKAVAGPKHPMTAANVKTIRIRNKQVKPDTGPGNFRL